LLILVLVFENFLDFGLMLDFLDLGDRLFMPRNSSLSIHLPVIGDRYLVLLEHFKSVVFLGILLTLSIHRLVIGLRV
jgi:hypothetical protein